MNAKAIEVEVGDAILHPIFWDMHPSRKPPYNTGELLCCDFGQVLENLRIVDFRIESKHENCLMMVL